MKDEKKSFTSDRESRNITQSVPEPDPRTVRVWTGWTGGTRVTKDDHGHQGGPGGPRMTRRIKENQEDQGEPRVTEEDQWDRGGPGLLKRTGFRWASWAWPVAGQRGEILLFYPSKRSALPLNAARLHALRV